MWINGDIFRAQKSLWTNKHFYPQRNPQILRSFPQEKIFLGKEIPDSKGYFNLVLSQNQLSTIYLGI